MLSKRTQRSIESEIKRKENKVSKLLEQASEMEALAQQLLEENDRLKALLEPKAE